MARRAPSVLFLFALVWAAPIRARAWTEAQVTSVAARVELASDATAHVRLDLKIAVHGGFLTELELAGLDPGLELDPSVPVVLTAVESGEQRIPSVEVRRDGRVTFRFRTREAPRRGQYTVSLAYMTSLAERGVTMLESGDVRFTWTLPGWRSGLDAVRIHVVAPRGAAPHTSTHWDDRTITVARRDLGDRVEIDLERAHLPRTVPLVVAIDIPRTSVAASLRTSVTARAAPRLDPTRAPNRAKTPFIIAALAVLLALAKKAAITRLAKRHDATSQPLVPLASRTAHTLLVLAAGALAASFPFTSPIAGFAGFVALIALTIERAPRATPRGRMGGFRPATRHDAKRARLDALREHLSPLALLDPLTPIGLAIAASTLAALAVMHVREPLDASDAAFTAWHALVLVGCQWLTTGTRLLPSTPSRRLAQLTALAKRFRTSDADDAPFALRLVVHTDAQGTLTDARIRIASTNRAPGLVRLDIAIADRPTLAGHIPVPVWLVVTRADTQADALLEAALPSGTKTIAPGGRRARILPFNAAATRLLRPLLRETPEAAQPQAKQTARRAS